MWSQIVNELFYLLNNKKDKMNSHMFILFIFFADKEVFCIAIYLYKCMCLNE